MRRGRALPGAFGMGAPEPSADGHLCVLASGASSLCQGISWLVAKTPIIRDTVRSYLAQPRIRLPGTAPS